MDNYSYVVCPICNKQLKVIIKTHFKVHGYTTKEDFLKDYPNAVLVSEEYRIRNAKIRKEVFTKLNKSEEQRHKASEHCKRLNQDSQRQSDKGRRGWTVERRELKSNQLKTAIDLINNSPDYLEFRQRRNNGLSYGKRHEYVTQDNRTLKLKSFTECRMAKFLENNVYEFEYESVEIPYISPKDGKIHNYFPDFYLPKFNLFLEVKPEDHQKDPITIAKQLAVVKLGYNFLFVSDSDLTRYRDLIDKINALDTK